MPVFKPNDRFLEEQIASIEAQTFQAIVLVFVNADCRSRGLLDDKLAESDLVYHIAEPDVPLNSYRAFEFGLHTALEMSQDGDVFALCDQDDIWHDDRISLGIAALDAAKSDMSHSDARVIDAHGRMIRPSLHRLEGRVHSSDLRALLLRNNVTGMTCTLSRQVVRAALPFPSQAALFFHHDLWLALVAAAMGGITFRDRALVDYRQHGSNVVGAIDDRPFEPVFGSPLWRRRRAGDHFVATYLAKCLYLRMVEVAEVDDHVVDKTALRRLAPYLSEKAVGTAFFRDAALWALRLRPGFALRSATFGAVRVARLMWAWQSAINRNLLPSLAEFDRKGFALAPGQQPDVIRNKPRCALPVDVVPAKSFADPRMSPKFNVTFDANRPGGIVILLPTLNPTEIFAGIATAIDFGLGLAAQNRHVTFVACDLAVASFSASKTFVLSRGEQLENREGIESRIHLHCGVTCKSIALNRDDRFFATAWWTAHVANTLIEAHGFTNKKILYLIQDFEPNFYPWGDECAAALESYDFDHTPIFNTTLLRDYFLRNGIGYGGEGEIAFGPSINIRHYAGLSRPLKKTRRLVVYGRPEVPRNLFPMAMLALDRFVRRENLARNDIEILSVGLAHDSVELSNGVSVRSVGKIPWDEYPEFLASVDVGLALMLSPHPSHLPIEMAAAGARVVTNGFGGKDLSRLSPAIISVPPSIGQVSKAVSLAWHSPRVTQLERQIDINQLGMPLADAVLALDRTLDSDGPRVLRIRPDGLLRNAWCR